MPLNQRELSTELHKTQNKLNKTKEELEVEMTILKTLAKAKDKKERRENIIWAVMLLSGVAFANIVAPRLIGTAVSMNFNPSLGPIDLFLIFWAGCGLWKGFKK